MKYISALLLIGLSLNAYATEVNQTTINAILAGPIHYSKVFISVANKPSQPLGCNTNSVYTYAFDASTEAGKVVFSLVMAAHLAGKEVTITGRSRCSLEGSIEDLAQIKVE